MQWRTKGAGSVAGCTGVDDTAARDLGMPPGVRGEGRSGDGGCMFCGDEGGPTAWAANASLCTPATPACARQLASPQAQG